MLSKVGSWVKSYLFCGGERQEEDTPLQLQQTSKAAFSQFSSEFQMYFPGDQNITMWDNTLQALADRSRQTRTLIVLIVFADRSEDALLDVCRALLRVPPEMRAKCLFAGFSMQKPIVK